MKRRATKIALILTASLTMLAGLASSSQACIGCLFGYGHAAHYPAAVYYGPACSPCYPVPACVPSGCRGSQIFYAPVCTPVCPPCGVPVGSCGVPAQVSPPTIHENGQWKGRNGSESRTYEKKDTQTKPPGGSDAGFGEREMEPGSPPKENGSEPFGAETKQGSEAPTPPRERKSFKVESNIPETVIEKKQPAPTKPVEENDKGGSKDAGAKGADDGKKSTKDSDDHTGQLRFPSIKLDDKITWRSLPTRKRIDIRATFGRPKIVRRTVPSNARWILVPRDVKIVKK